MEIERKFLIEKVPDDLKPVKEFKIVQHYLSESPELRIRSMNGTHFTLTVKSNGNLVREEYEVEISGQTFDDLRRKSIGSIHKVRKYYKYNCYEISVDFYEHRELKEVRIAEVEFRNEQEAESFETPNWFGREVTEDKNFKNKNLVLYFKAQSFNWNDLNSI